MTEIIKKCGTHQGYRAHRDCKERACDDCKKAHAEYQKIWRENNKDKAQAIQHRYFNANIEKVHFRNSRWRLSNLDKKRRLNARYKARKRDNFVAPYTEQQVLDAYGILCNICQQPIDLNASRRSGDKGWEMGLHFDHVIPLFLGGDDSLSNVRPTHGLCNVKKNKYV